MKKIIALLTLSVFLMGILTGCAQSQTSQGDNIEAGSVGEENGSDTADQDSSSVTEERKKPDYQIVFDGLTVVDNDEYTFQITGIQEDDYYVYTLSARLENKSSENKYYISATKSVIDGLECSPFYAAQVAPGETVDGEIECLNWTFVDKGMLDLDFTDIELFFDIFVSDKDSDSWTDNLAAEETTHVYPFGEENATTYVREAQDTDNVIVDNEYVTVIVTGYENDDIWGYVANLYLVNKTDSYVTFSADEITVNGSMVDSFYYSSLQPGSSKFDRMHWSESTLEENGITEVEEIKFLFTITDFYADLSEGDLVNETITLNP